MTKFFAWLRAKRGVVALRAQTDQGEKTVTIGTSRRRFSEAETTLTQLGTSSVEALDKSGNVIAVFSDFEAGASDDAVNEAKRKKELRDLASATAEGRALYLMAQLLADAYKHSTNVAFERMVDIVGLQNARAQSQEKSLSHLEKVLARVAAQAAKAQAGTDDEDEQPEGNVLEVLASSFMQGQLAKAGVPTPGAAPQTAPGPVKTKANGVARPKGEGSPS